MPQASSTDSLIQPLLIERPNLLKEKMGGALSPALCIKAELVVAAMQKDFEKWLEETVAQLYAVWKEMGEDPLNKQKSHELLRNALEVKSLGETYGFPLATRIAHSLCRLIVRIDATGFDNAHKVLLDAHVNAIRAVLRDKIKNADDPMGAALASELEARVFDLY